MSQRKWYLAELRVASIISVVVIHVSAQYWGQLSPTGYDWWITNVFDGLARWSVPVFVMISGALFLDPDRKVSIRRLYSKNIVKILVIILVWGFVYAVLYRPLNEMSMRSLLSFVKEWLFGHYHMWFLYMILGLYVLVPVLRRIASSDSCMKYYLVIAFAVNSVIPFVTSFDATGTISALFSKASIQLPVGFSFYFVLGYWLSRTELSPARARMLYLAGVLGGIVTVLLTGWASVVAGAPVQTYYSYFMLPVAVTSAAVFVAFHQKGFVPHSGRARKAIALLSKLSLGVYLVHIFVLDNMIKIGIDSMCANPIVAIPVTALIAAIVSYLISFILSKIPFFGRYIV